MVTLHVMTYVSERKSIKSSKMSEENVMILKLLSVNHFLNQKELVQHNTELLSMTRHQLKAIVKIQHQKVKTGCFNQPNLRHHVERASTRTMP